MGRMSKQSSEEAHHLLFQKVKVSPTVLEYFDRASSRTPATFWKKSFHVSALLSMSLAALQVSTVTRSSEGRNDATLKGVYRFVQSENQDSLQKQAFRYTVHGRLTEEQAYSEMLKSHS